jgi:hypothetical protein
MAHMREAGVKADAHGGVRLSGLALGFAGALLDFYSGYLLLTDSGTSTDVMGMVTQSNAAALAWGIGVSALGATVAVTTIIAILPIGAYKMRDLGALMAVYGVAMLFFGSVMYLGVTSMMQGTSIVGLGMLIVGALMMLNGAIMRRSQMS